MRVYLIWMVFFFFTLYVWKDWWKALCFLVFMMVFVERPDMPKSVFGIPGLNPWNLLLAFVMSAAFLSSERSHTKDIKIETKVVFLFWWYVGVILISFVRGVIDTQGIVEFATLMGRNINSKQGMFIDDVVNVIKYMLPGIFFYYGCNSMERFKLGLLSVLLLNLFIALLIIKSVSFGYLTDGYSLQKAAKRVIERDIGYHRSDLAVLLGGGAWALYAYRNLFKSTFLALCTNISVILATIAILLTGGRIGLGSWAVTITLLSYLRWRKFFVIAPIFAVLMIGSIPAVQERLLQGFGAQDDIVEIKDKKTDTVIETTDPETDMTSVTSGRTIIWPYVIEKIGESPIYGYGRHAMQRTGLSLDTAIELQHPFPHPHNAYLQLLIDNGWLLSVPVFYFYFLMLKYSISLFRDDSSKIYIAAGGASIAFIVAQLVGGIAGQSFYPMTSHVSMWCVIGLMLRVYYERERINREFSEEQRGNQYDDPWKMSISCIEEKNNREKRSRNPFLRMRNQK
jgi:hypothetical protein